MNQTKHGVHVLDHRDTELEARISSRSARNISLSTRQVPAAGDQSFCLAAASVYGLKLSHLVAFAGNDQRFATSDPLKHFVAMVP
ncbi:hypothetical protein J2S90_002760 [Arthrobacter bambusae]|uniref:Uncharacterized protein n=1 Tax=Arthrobacter bambusae TaxID=1338426 RepID=A0AAW8DK17_9MICC|nr:hypothetical protein [Arthrobacter bambusae]